jgi:hypothetical protein
MSEWTQTARRALEAYCARSRAALAGTGADAGEVVEDLRRHIEEELRHANLSVVTEEDVRRVLARIGEPQVDRGDQAAPAGVSPAVANPATLEKARPGWIIFTLGVVLPAATLLFELFTGISAGVLFDPLPSWLHVVLVALVWLSALPSITR